MQAIIHVRTPQKAFCMMATNVATALEIHGDDHIRPVTWDEWITLPVRPQDNAVQTVRGQIRVPTVIVVSGPFVGARLCLQDQPQRLSVWEAFGPQECCGWCSAHNRAPKTDATRVGVVDDSNVDQGSPLRSQPWAERWNPFGIQVWRRSGRYSFGSFSARSFSSGSAPSLAPAGFLPKKR